jgi:methionyl-tRNA synthetase
MCSPIVQTCPVCGEETKTIDKCQWCGTDLAEREEVEQLTDAQVFAITPAEDLW